MHDLITEGMCWASACPDGNHKWGKFNTCLDEAIHTQSLDWADETTGNVDWDVHLSMLTISPDSVAILDENDDKPRYVLVKAGTYLVYENGQGFVTVEHYENQPDAERIFREIEARYDAWDNDDDDQDDDTISDDEED